MEPAVPAGSPGSVMETTSLGVHFEENVPVPMRDGTILRANIFRPEAKGRYPALLTRTPYGKAAGGQERFVLAGYVVVAQDTRGRYASDGEWIPLWEPDTGEAEDGYDTVEWVAAQPWCNGRVGTMGASYCAWTQWMLARLRPPHLVAMSARSIPPEWTGVDWWGGFKPARRIHWWLTQMAPDLRRRHGLPPPHTIAEARKMWDELERGLWLGFLPWSKISKHLPPGLAEYAESWFKEPNRRPWRFDEHYGEIDVPNLDVSGWYDHCNGTIRHLAGMQAGARSEMARTQSRLIVGPWNHVGMGARELGDGDFGPAAQMDLNGMLIRWFDHWLKGDKNGVEQDPAVRYFVMGSNEWKSAPAWPPRDTDTLELFLHNEASGCGTGIPGVLTREVPSQSEPPDTYSYDPDDPVPSLWSPMFFTWPSDRRRLDHRRDILRYVSEPLAEDIEIAGDPTMVLYAASSAPDTDFFARLADDGPDGPALEISYGMVRARHRASFDEEDLLSPGEVTEFRIQMGPTACRFRKGHRIRLEITSSEFPNHDRNHNVGRNDLFDAEFAVAEQTVFHAKEFASCLVLPVVAG